MTNDYWARVSAPHADRDRSEREPSTDPAADAAEGGDEDREREYSEAILAAWLVIEEGPNGTSFPRIATTYSSRKMARAVMAVADAELADLRAEFKRWRAANGPALFEEAMDAILCRAEAAEAARDEAQEKLARIEETIAEYRSMAAKNDDVRFGADSVIEAVEWALQKAALRGPEAAS